MTDAARLANWIRANQAELTHLKLQKLVFYCYGITSALGHRLELGHVHFVAWKHGPVCEELYREYRDFGTEQIPQLPPQSPPPYSHVCELALKDVLRVYGWLSPWQIRNQSHLEKPWGDWDRVTPSWTIDDNALVAHFQHKFANDRVWAPEYVSGAWSLELDRIPPGVYSSFHELAQSLPA